MTHRTNPDVPLGAGGVEQLEPHFQDIESVNYENYRALSVAAVVAFVLALISLVAFAFHGLLAIPCTAVFVSAYALWSISKNGDEVSGRGLSQAAFAISTVTAVTVGSIAAYTYYTEVPEGYQRISFVDLQPTNDRPDLPISPSALNLDGQKVFVPGYIHPYDKGGALKRFVLVPDMGTCCFGGKPKLTDMIEVTLRDPHRVKYSMSKIKLGGVLKVDTRKKPVSGLDGVYYQLDADYLTK
ncbi:MAG: DUF3299 domain-containing protein [Pirellulaceae bacterium]|nr:DUF3299 domain-containing protein [Planctomycetales bacterium]